MSWYIRGELAFRDDRYFFPDLDPDVRDGYGRTPLHVAAYVEGLSNNYAPPSVNQHLAAIRRQHPVDDLH